MHLDGEALDWALLGSLAEQSYRLIAPKRVAAQLPTSRAT